MSRSSIARQAARLRARGPEAPVVLDPRAGKPRRHSVAPAAIGEVRIRRDAAGARGTPCRFIKVANGGPTNLRWRPYARWWWEQNRGPIPAGKVVIHLDGDRLNDDPSNLAIGTTDDALFIAHNGRPGRNDSALRRQRIREHNVARARLRRLQGPMLGRWYLVDRDARRIWNTGDEHRHQALARVGVVVPEGSRVTGVAWIGACLGWPDLAPGEAAILAVLADATGPLTLRRVRELGTEMLARFGKPAPTRDTWSSRLCALRRRGWVMRKRRGPMLISMAALVARGRTTRLLPLRADNLGPYEGYTWVSERGQEYQRVAGSMVAQLAEAIS